MSKPETLRVMIADDEPRARQYLERLLSEHEGIEVVGSARNGAEAFAIIARTHPDAAFLDIHMPDVSGLEVARHLKGDDAPVVVFVTAYDEHALRAFEVNAVDYLLKPYDDLRFTAALQRAKEAVRLRRADGVNTRLAQLLGYLQQNGERPGAPARAEEGAGDRILVKSSGEVFFLKAGEIDWIEAEGDYMKFHVGGRAHLMRETMARLEARLDPKRFIRIHRSTIVNLDRLRKLVPAFGGDYAVILEDGTKLKLSRGYHERIAALMKQAR